MLGRCVNLYAMHITESARAHSYYSVSRGMQTVHSPGAYILARQEPSRKAKLRGGRPVSELIGGGFNQFLPLKFAEL